MIVAVGYTAHWVWRASVHCQVIADIRIVLTFCLGTESFGLGNMKITKKCTFCVLMANHELCVCHIYATSSWTEQANCIMYYVLCIAIEWNIVYFRHIK